MISAFQYLALKNVHFSKQGATCAPTPYYIRLTRELPIKLYAFRESNRKTLAIWHFYPVCNIFAVTFGYRHKRHL